MKKKNSYVTFLRVAAVLVLLVGGVTTITILEDGFGTPKTVDGAKGFHESDIAQQEDLHMEGVMTEVEDYVVNPKTIGFSKDELVRRAKEVATAKGVSWVVDDTAEVYKGSAYDTVLLTSEDSPVQVNALLSKTDGYVTQVSVGSNTSTPVHQQQVREAVSVLVEATNRTGEGSHGIENRLLSVQNGQVNNEVVEGIVYSTSASANNGLMMYIEGM